MRWMQPIEALSARLRLGDSHIFSGLAVCSEVPSAIDCIEFIEAASNGDWPWWLAVAVPAAEATGRKS